MKAIFFLLALLNVSVNAFCPDACTCSELTATCDSAQLDSIPIFLNPQLESLSLRNNRISSLSASQLGIYRNLRYLDLSHNQISTLEAKTFQKLTNLKTLRLNANGLKSMSELAFTGIKSLELLDLSHNSLVRLSTSQFVELGRLHTLNVSYNELTLVSPGAFTGLNSLELLDASQNLLREIPIDALHSVGETLTTIDLSFNRLTRLSNATFEKLGKVVKADFSHNRIDKVKQSAFIGATSLRTLILSNNQLSMVPTLALSAQSSLNELRILRLDGNNFRALPTSCLDGLPQLEQLSINSCPQLQRVELNAFSGLYGLISLELSYNKQLVSIDSAAFEHPNQLRRVILRANALSTLPHSLLNWAQLDQLDLDNNPWLCDCAMTWLHREPRMSQLTKALCTAPEQSAGVVLTEFSSSCSEGWETMPIYQRVGIICGPLLVLLVLVLLIVLFCQERIFGACARLSTKSAMDTSNSVASSRCSPYSDVDAGSNGYYVDNSSKRSLLVAKSAMDDQRLMQLHHSGTLPTQHHAPAPTVLPQRFNTLLDQHHYAHTTMRPISVRTNEYQATTYRPYANATRPVIVEEDPCYASIPILMPEHEQIAAVHKHNDHNLIQCMPNRSPRSNLNVEQYNQV